MSNSQSSPSQGHQTCTEAKRAHSPHQPVGRWIRPEKRLAIYIRDRFACLYCGTDLRTAAPEQVTLDHLLPRSQGGSNEAENLVTACRACNSSRGDRGLTSFAPGGALERIQDRIHVPLNVPLAKALMQDRAGDPALEALR